ncbi:MAG TPA: spore photoproduct lyase [Syntrophomonadaceae bacterium]|nr:spore photoproduct lyase [Syntrophomonadaceae bacterium]
MKIHTGLHVSRVFFEENALHYPLGNQILQRVQKAGLDVQYLKSHNRVTGIPGKNPREAFFEGKNSLVIGVRKGLDFAGCKPSAHFQLPLITGCPGICEYCYLNTNLGGKPYIRIYINIEDILSQAANYIEERRPQTTTFEASAVGDPVAIEELSGTLAASILFFADQDLGRLRIATKYPCPPSLLDLVHKGHTRIRYTVNSESIIQRYEHRTPPLGTRLTALKELIHHDYPVGIMIAPIFLEGDWQSEYRQLLETVRRELPEASVPDLHFEVISHRFTSKAHRVIDQVFPHHTLPIDEKTGRMFKYGQFGYGKYLYNTGQLAEMRDFFSSNIARLFPEAHVEYII